LEECFQNHLDRCRNASRAGMMRLLSLQVVFAVRRDNTKDLKNFEDFDIGSLTSTGYIVETDITEDLK